MKGPLHRAVRRARTLLLREVMILIITFPRRGPSHEGPRLFSAPRMSRVLIHFPGHPRPQSL